MIYCIAKTGSPKEKWTSEITLDQFKLQAMPIFQFRVSLLECSFSHWRRFKVTDDYRLNRFFWGDEPPESYKDYDPEFFPIKETNAELALFGAWHKKHPRAKSTPWHQIKKRDTDYAWPLPLVASKFVRYFCLYA